MEVRSIRRAGGKALDALARRTVQPILERGEFGTPRDYFLALGEYQRRRGQPLDALELSVHELRVSSQNGEDGVIQEILRRTGTSSSPYFVEFGIQKGNEGNSVLLADHLGWSGLFIEAAADDFAALTRKYSHGRVQTVQAYVRPDNVEQIFRDANVPTELDVLSIDIDGDDYWVWKAIDAFRPRLLVIEYNSGLAHDQPLVQPYGAGLPGLTSYFGASLAALTELGEAKGYRLVHTETAGANAFFVRDEKGHMWPPVRIAGTNYHLRADRHPDPEDDPPGYVTP